MNGVVTAFSVRLIVLTVESGQENILPRGYPLVYIVDMLLCSLTCLAAYIGLQISRYICTYMYACTSLLYLYN